MSREDPSYFKIPKWQGILHERGYLQIKEQKLGVRELFFMFIIGES